jgi:IgGFc binding protein
LQLEASLDAPQTLLPSSPRGGSSFVAVAGACWKWKLVVYVKSDIERRMRPALAAAIGIGVVLVLVSCGANPREPFEPDAGMDGAAAPPEAGGGAFPDVMADAPVATFVPCSADLHDVLDPSGRVLETCPPDQGCAAGKCVPACEAARQNASTVGCDYYVAPPDSIPGSEGGCFAAFVVNTWGTPVKIGVEWRGEALAVDRMTRVPSGSGPGLTYAPLVGGEIPPGEVAIVFLSQHGSFVSCPSGVEPGYTIGYSKVSGTGKGYAFHITASAPVTAYDIYPYGGGSSAVTSATLLLPTSVWGKNYVGVNPYPQSLDVDTARNFLQIVAQEDDTEVKILPVVDILSGAGVSPTPAKTTGTYELQRGELLQFEQPGELTGSAIESDKPIGVFGGASCINVGYGPCDAAHQQLPPVSVLGSRYAAVRYRNRFDGVEESPPWRVVGVVDGTILSYDPVAPWDAPTTLAAGQVAKFDAPGPFVVKSQDDAHPFYMSAYMTGCFEPVRGPDCRGDPEFVNVVPPEQYLRSYVFFTDPTYPETNLVIVRQKIDGVFSDVNLDCAGALAGWEPIGTGGELEYLRFDLVRGNFEKQESCDNGKHEIQSDGPFGLTVWGWGSAATAPIYSGAVSYAYPAGAGVRPVNAVVVPTEPH